MLTIIQMIKSDVSSKLVCLDCVIDTLFVVYTGGCTTYRKTLVSKAKTVSTPVKRKKRIRNGYELF